VSATWLHRKETAIQTAYQPTKQHRSSNQLFLLKAPVKTEIARHSFSRAAPAMLNNLPLYSWSTEIYERFRSVTKKYFYQLAFTNWSR